MHDEYQAETHHWPKEVLAVAILGITKSDLVEKFGPVVHSEMIPNLAGTTRPSGVEPRSSFGCVLVLCKMGTKDEIVGDGSGVFFHRTKAILLV